MNVINSGNFTNPAVSGQTQIRIIDGIKVGVVEEQIELDGSSSYDLTSQLPIGAIIILSQLKVDSVITTTATKIGLGRKEATADPDKYLLTSDLSDGTSGGAMATGILSSASAVETLQVVACDTNGDSAGSLDSGTATARIVYLVAESLL